jgi:hypothetical protein
MVVRMSFDPALVAKVYGAEPVAGLDEAGRAMLTKPDRRAWATDPYRRTRSLTALLEEFPASAAQAGVQSLDGFFSSEAFHQLCEQRGSMAMGFGAWVEALAGPVARLETAIARIRRHQPLRAPGIGLASTAAVVELPAGTMDQYQALRAQLGPEPVVSLATGKMRPIELPQSAESQTLLIQRGQTGDVSLTQTSAVLASLLRAADPAVSRQALVAAAVGLGASAEEAGEIIDELLEEGLLEQGPEQA